MHATNALKLLLHAHQQAQETAQKLSQPWGHDGFEENELREMERARARIRSETNGL